MLEVKEEDAFCVGALPIHKIVPSMGGKIQRSHSGIASTSTRSCSSSFGSASSRSSVSFDPHVHEVIFDKREAPCQIRTLKPRASIPHSPALKTFPPLVSMGPRRVERRHMIRD